MFPKPCERMRTPESCGRDRQHYSPTAGAGASRDFQFTTRQLQHRALRTIPITIQKTPTTCQQDGIGTCDKPNAGSDHRDC